MGLIEFPKDSRGNTHWLIRQTVDMSCLPACAAMAWCLCKGGNCMADPEGWMTMCAAAKGWNPWDGADLNVGAQILSDVGVRVDQPRYFADGLYNHLYLKVWDYSPAILALKKHATLCKHVYSDGLCIFLDPGAGLIEWRPEYYPYYKLPDGRLEEFSGWVLTTNMS